MLNAEVYLDYSTDLSTTELLFISDLEDNKKYKSSLRLDQTEEKSLALRDRKIVNWFNSCLKDTHAD